MYECIDRAVSAIGRYADVNEEDLVFVVLDQAVERHAELDELAVVELTSRSLPR